MGLYNFKPQFAPWILDGSKRHTIRPERRNPDKPGNTVYLYTGLRTRKCTRLLVAECVAVRPVVIDTEGIHIDGDTLSRSEANELAYIDGFREWGKDRAWEMLMACWTDGSISPQYRLPFRGHIIHWKPGKEETK